MLTKIFLIRHGETQWNAIGRLQGSSDVELSPEGIEQARRLAAHFPAREVGAIYSSDLVRAVMTAEILAAKFNLPVIKVSDLRETNFGDWEGKFFDELAKEYPVEFEKFFKSPEELCPPHGETFLESQVRAWAALGKIFVEHENQNVVVVSHGAVIRLILCAALEIPIRKMWAISQFNLAVNILRMDDGQITVELVNGSL